MHRDRDMERHRESECLPLTVHSNVSKYTKSFKPYNISNYKAYSFKRIKSKTTKLSN